VVAAYADSSDHYLMRCHMAVDQVRLQCLMAEEARMPARRVVRSRPCRRVLKVEMEVMSSIREMTR
jgi:hypothetical protein